MSLKIWLPLNGNIENQGTLNTTSRLPSGYTEVEYLESSGTQWIDTGYTLNSSNVPNIKYYLDAMALDNAVGNYWWANGIGGGSGITLHVGIGNGSGSTFPFTYGDGVTDRVTSVNGQLNTRYQWELDMKNSTYKVYGNSGQPLVNISCYKQTPTQSQNLALFRWYNYYGTGSLFGMRIFNMKLWSNESLVRHLIPALRNSDNKPGMYDTVTGTFYTNTGSGEFSVGPKVIATPTIKKGSLVFNSVGKLGTTCTFDGSQVIDSGLRYNQITTGKLTICAWCNASTMSADMNVLGSELSSGGINFCEIRQSNYAAFYANSASGSDILYINSGTMSANTWYHFAYVIENLSNGTSKATLYRDGVYVNSVTYAGLVGLPDYPIYIGRAVDIYRINDDNNYQWKGMIQDIRIYDECLSADQIKEISRGMVLHYKMCQPERSENLLANGAATEITCRSKNPDYPLKAIRTTLENNTQYTLSFDAKSDNGLGTFYCSLANGGSSKIYFATKIKPTTKYKHYIYTVTRGTQSVNNILFAAYYDWSGNANVTDTIHIKNVKLEKGSNPNATFSPPSTETLNWGTIEYDGSGYKNHGTVFGNVTLSADSPRYTGSYKFGTNNYITTTSTGNYIKSATFWAKDDGSVPRDGLVFRDQNSGLAFGIQSGNLITGAVGGPAGSSSASVSVSNAKYTANTWHFFACVNDNGTHRLYMDGMQISTGTGTGNWSQGSPTNSLNVGGRAGSSYWPGYISDFRMYVTVLSATDVQELYKLGRI